jgi:PleD family two-component response regulator
MAAEGDTCTVAAMTTPKAKASKRILVVDDDRDGAEAVAVLLRLEGHTVETASRLWESPHAFIPRSYC